MGSGGTEKNVRGGAAIEHSRGKAHVGFPKTVKWKVALVVGGILSVSRLLVLWN